METMLDSYKLDSRKLGQCGECKNPDIDLV